MTINTTIHTFLNDAEDQLKSILKEQENYDDMIELILLPSIREQVETILTKQTGVELTETSSSFLGEKKMLNNVCNDLDNVDWEQLGEGMKEKIDELRGELREKLEEEYVEEVKRVIKEEMSLGQWIEMTQKIKKELKLTINGIKYGLNALSRLFGINGNPIGKNNTYFEILHIVFGKEKVQEEVLESHIQTLEEEGITDMESLLSFGSVKYTKIFGKSLIGKILGRLFTMVTVKDLEELGGKLGYNEKKREDFDSHRKELKVEGITDMESLLKFGVVKYQKKFGVSFIGKTVGRIITQVSLKDLWKLGGKLGYKEKKREDLLDSHKKELEVEGIIDMESLLNFGSVKYQKKFGVSFVGKILGSVIRLVNLKNLQDLGEQLGYQKKIKEELLDSHIRQLDVEGITDIESLLKFGVARYKSKFGMLIIGQIIGRLLKNIRVQDLYELGKKLGYIELFESHRQALDVEGITDMESLLHFGSIKYKKRFGQSIIGKILGRTVPFIKIKDLNELGEKLWSEIPKDKINHE